MKSGIKYVDGMDLHGVIKAGLEDFELDYTGCKSADMILENGGNIDGIAVSLCDFIDKGFTIHDCIPIMSLPFILRSSPLLLSYSVKECNDCNFSWAVDTNWEPMT